MNKTNAIIFFLLFGIILSCSKHSSYTRLVIEQDVGTTSKTVIFGKGFDDYIPEIIENKIVYTISPSRSDYYYLKIGDFSTSIILNPGDSIYVSSQFKNAENKSFTGKGSLLNNYILNDICYANEINNNMNFDSIYSLSPLDFIKSIDSIYYLRSTKLKKFITSENITNKLFVSTENKRIYYAASIEKNRYYRDHKFLTSQKQKLDNVYNSYLKNVDYNDPSLMHLRTYRDFLYTYFEKVGLQQQDSLKNGQSSSELAFSEACNKLEGMIKSYVLYRIMDIHLIETPINKLGNLIDDFNKECLNLKYKEEINRHYNRLEKLKSGKPAPNFTFRDRTGKNVSLYDFKGKIVYIDIWNSHCSPCFKEFTAFEKLTKIFYGEEIAFLGISFDTDQELWKRTIKVQKLKGVQLFANGWNHQFGKDYLVYSNPRFILIDSKGNFINAKAPNPSENIEDIIKHYLNVLHNKANQ